MGIGRVSAKRGLECAPFRQLFLNSDGKLDGIIQGPVLLELDCNTYIIALNSDWLSIDNYINIKGK